MTTAIKDKAIVGWLVTAIYLSGWVLYACTRWDEFSKLSPNSWGDVFAGIAAPLAFAWLVLGYFQQGRELSQNTEALRQQERALNSQNDSLKLQNEALRIQAQELVRANEQAAAQASVIRANEQHARRDTFMRFHDLIVAQLSERAGVLCNRLRKTHGESMAIAPGYTVHLGIDRNASDWIAELDRVLANLVTNEKGEEIAGVLRAWIAGSTELKEVVSGFVELSDMAWKEATDIGFDRLFCDANYVRVANRVKQYRLIDIRAEKAE